MTNIPIRIFYDFKKAQKAIKNLISQKRNRFLRDFIYEKIKKLDNNKHYIMI